MGLKELRIGELCAKIPVIQGGMGVGISLHRLAGAVAAEGGIGIISTAQIGYREPDYDENPIRANLRAIKQEIDKARELAKGGIIGVNIMVATRFYEDYVKAAVAAGVDLIISGAGLPVNLPELVGSAKTKLAPIVSSLKSAQVICKYWKKKYDREPDMVVIEGPEAGGHLGFTPEQLTDIPALNYDAEISRIIEYVHGLPTKDGEEIPVGMPGRAINNAFMKRAKEGRIPHSKCHLCVSTCKPAETPYCITDALVNAAVGNVDEALLFCGSNAYRAKKLEFVKDIMQEFAVKE